MSYSMFNPVAWFVLVFAGVLSIGLLARHWGVKTLQKWSRRTETPLDDFMLEAARLPSIFWAIALGLYVAVGMSDLPKGYILTAFTTLHALVILSVTLALANLLSRVVTYSVQRAEVPIPLTGLSQAVIKGTVMTIGVLILLGTLGISITPLLTALGVGGLAVALALQDTLGNLFAGMHILVEKSIRVGDFIRLESGQEGYVADIGWRTTKVRLQPNTMVIIPNSKLAQSVVTNYDLPEKPMVIPIPVSVGYDTDPDQVERILIEEATRAAKEVPGMMDHPEPIVRLTPGFGDFSLNYTLFCPVKGFEAQQSVQHEIRKRILKRFKKEGIEMPFPVRTVYLKQDKAQ